MDLKIPNTLQSAFVVFSYAPIALFAENLRVYNAVLCALTSRSLLLPAVTGSIKDLERLWYFRERELFGDLSTELRWKVASLRHGNSFPLANRRLLEQAGIVGRTPRIETIPTSEEYNRPTFVNVSFITTPNNGNDSLAGEWDVWRCGIVTVAQLVAQVVTAIGLGFYGLQLSSLLVACLPAATLTLMAIRVFLCPYFGNRNAISKDARLKVSGGAALDVHIITSDENSESIDVVCGFSSQLHSLTNIPVRLGNHRFAKWAFRFLLLILIAQAAILTSMLGRSDGEAIGSTIWLILYLTTRIGNFISGPKGQMEKILERQPAKVDIVPQIVFKGRRTALLFIARLPFTEKADKWSWMNLYMPDNSRRRQWTSEFENLWTMTIADCARHASEEIRSSYLDIQKALKVPAFDAKRKLFDLSV